MPTTKTPKKKDARKATTTEDLIESQRAHRAESRKRYAEIQQTIRLRHEDTVANIETNRKYLIAIERKLDLVLSSNSLLQELNPKKEEQGKFKEGDPVKHAVTGKIGTFINYGIEHSNVRLSNGGAATWRTSNLEKPSAEEIESSAYGERDGLEEYDQCICTKEQIAELLRLAKDGGIQLHHREHEYTQVDMIGVWWYEGKLTALRTTEDKGASFPVFKKLLIKTIEKLRAAREEEEAKKKLEFGQRVKWIDHGQSIEGVWLFKLDSGRHRVFGEGHFTSTDLARSEFTVLNN